MKLLCLAYKIKILFQNTCHFHYSSSLQSIIKKYTEKWFTRCITTESYKHQRLSETVSTIPTTCYIYFWSWAQELNATSFDDVKNANLGFLSHNFSFFFPDSVISLLWPTQLAQTSPLKPQHNLTLPQTITSLKPSVKGSPQAAPWPKTWPNTTSKPLGIPCSQQNVNTNSEADKKKHSL